MAQAVEVANAASSYDTNIKFHWSDAIKEISFEKGIERERLNAIERMIQAGATKEQLFSFGYTEKEFTEAEDILYTNT